MPIIRAAKNCLGRLHEYNRLQNGPRNENSIKALIQIKEKIKDSKHVDLSKSLRNNIDRITKLVRYYEDNHKDQGVNKWKKMMRCLTSYAFRWLRGASAPVSPNIFTEDFILPT